MSISEWYFELQRKYEQKYGPKTVVLMALGIFYEVYEYDPTRADPVDLKNKGVGHSTELCRILNMRLTSKDKNKPHSLSNPMMMGFPIISYGEHYERIIQTGYRIVKVDQKDRGGLKEDVEREVTKIVSSGTDLDQPTASSNSICSLYVDLQRPKRGELETTKVLIGLSSIDVQTGRSIVCEVYSKENDTAYPLQEIYRFLTSNRPTEILIHLRGPAGETEEYSKYIGEQLELDRYLIKIIRCNSLNSNFHVETYQEAMLGKAFGTEKMILGTTSFIDHLDLELLRYGLISYLVLLQYIYEHDESLIKRLERPQMNWIDQDDYLVLTHNAIDQLDLFPKDDRRKDSKDSVFSVLDFTNTAFGSRALRRRLMNPTTRIDQLELSYSSTQELIDDPSLLNRMNLLLKGLPDIERLHRKIQIGLIKPREFVQLFRSYPVLIQLYSSIDSSNGSSLKSAFLNRELLDSLKRINENVSGRVDLDILDQVKPIKGGFEATESFVQQGVDADLDQAQSHFRKYQDALESVCEILNDMAGSSRGKKIEPVLERNTKGEMICGLYTTPTKMNVIRRSPKAAEFEFHATRTKSIMMITSDSIRQITSGIEELRRQLEERLHLFYREMVKTIGTENYFAQLNESIANLDVLQSNARMALKYNYFQPTIDTVAGDAYLNVQELRHPLIERLIRTEYIPNDLSLGSRPNGLLLFGVNSAGKSSMAKALGVTVIMAQAGLYVPGKLIYRPFSKIITRLSGHDDLMKGKSSFIIEMTELRTILRSADRNTLVVGDELCRGTETLSGSSLTVATIQTLIEREVKFIFSTHMHHLPKIGLIEEATRSEKLQIAHLTTNYDEVSGRLIYGRKLEPGPGSSLYGLEVCKSLGVDREFIQLSNQIRREIEHSPDLFVNTKKSRYNSQVYVDKCNLCGVRSDLQSHHLKEQSEADGKGFIEHHHKNAQFNLMVLCESCHRKIHQESKRIVTQQTLEGTYIGPN